MPNRLAGATEPVPAAARRQPRRLVGVVGRGVRGGRPGGTCRCCSRSATRPATGATSWRTSRSRTTATAAQVNAGLRGVKVDREERPDIDAVYMAATQAMTGQGGWPMTCFLTPAGEPFYCGTYYPTAAASGGCSAAVDAGVDATTARGCAARRGRSRPGWPTTRRPRCRPRRLDAAALDAAVQALRRRASTRCTAGSAARRSSRRRWCWSSCCATTSAPARRSALHDGRRRPARRWPAAACTTSSPAGSPATASTRAGWCRTSRRCSTTTRCCCGSTRTSRRRHRLARSPGGWPTRPRLPAARPAHRRGRVRLGARRRHRRRRGPDLRLDARAAARGARRARTAPGRRELLAVTDGGHVRARRLDAAAARRPRRPGALAARAGRAARRARPAPAAAPRRQGRHGLERAGDRRARRGRAPRWAGRTGCAAADAAADLLLDRHVVDGRLRRSSRDGVVGAAAGVLEDHAALAEACSRCTRPPARRAGSTAAVELLDVDPRALRRRRRRRAFFDTADDAEALLHRPREITDNATPCGAAALAGALLTASVLVDDPRRYRDAAEAALRGGGHAAAAIPPVRRPLADGRPRRGRGARCRSRSSASTPTGTLLAGHARAIAPGGTVVVAGAPDAPGVPLLAAPAARRRRRGGLRLPRLRLRPPRHDRRGAHRRPPPHPVIARESARRAGTVSTFVCDLPARTIAEWAAQLRCNLVIADD